jgi:hypothetical protein
MFPLHGQLGPLTTRFAGGGAAPSTLLEGLTNWWRLDEGEGVRLDHVGTAHMDLGTSTGVTGLVGKAASFTGGGGSFLRAGLPQTIVTDGGIGKHTWSFWIWYDQADLTTNNYFFQPGGTQYYTIHVGSGTFRSTLKDASNIDHNTDFTLNSGQWNHIVMTSRTSDNRARLYINNVEILGDVINGHQTANQLVIGAYGNGTALHTKCKIDLIGCWNRDLTVAEISELNNGGAGVDPTLTTPTYSGTLDDGLLHYWRMDEDSGTRADRGSDPIQLAAYNSPGVLGGLPSGLGTTQGTKFSGDTNNDYLMAEGTDFDRFRFNGQDWTFAGWVWYPASLPNSDYLVYTTNGSSYCTRAYSTGGDSIFHYAGGSDGADHNPARTLTPNAWNYLMMWQDTSLSHWVWGRTNATEHGENAWTTSMFDAHSLVFGAAWRGTSAWGAYGVAHWGFWNRALTVDERNELWNSGNGVDPTA